MSTVIWRKGIMYADTQGTPKSKIIDGVEIPVETNITVKIFKENNRLYGVVGEIGGWQVFQDRARRNQREKWSWSFKKQWHATIIEWDGEELIGWHFHQKRILGIYFSRFKEEKLDKNKNAIMGFGEDFAIEALDLKLTPVEAIQYASDRDPWTNTKVMSLTL